jgi:hypothetical protein
MNLKELYEQSDKALTALIGGLIIAPAPVIEQLCNKLEAEKYPLGTELHVATLRAFLHYRPQMLQELRAKGFEVPND